MVVDLEDCVVTCFSVPGVGHGGGSGGLCCDLFQCPRCWR